MLSYVPPLLALDQTAVLRRPCHDQAQAPLLPVKQCEKSWCLHWESVFSKKGQQSDGTNTSTHHFDPKVICQVRDNSQYLVLRVCLHVLTCFGNKMKQSLCWCSFSLLFTDPSLLTDEKQQRFARKLAILCWMSRFTASITCSSCTHTFQTTSSRALYDTCCFLIA